MSRLEYSDLVDIKKHGRIAMKKSTKSQTWIVLLGNQHSFTFTTPKGAENKYARLIKVYGEKK